jgi:hypothetical protein
MRWALAAGVLALGCVPQLSGAPCHSDDNCPGTQYCNGTSCQTGTPPATRVTALLVTAPAGIVPLGSTVQATATAVLQSGDRSDVTASATWNSSNGLVAQVSNDAGTAGTVSALQTGEVDIGATLGSETATVHLVVTDAKLLSLVVTVDRPQVAPRTDLACTAVGFFTDGTHADLSSLASWTSTAPSVVSVSNAPGSVGALAALAPGTAQVSATYQELSDFTAVSVTGATLLGVAISPLLPWVSISASATLEATGLFSDGSAQPMTRSVQWTVDDPSLAFFVPAVPGELQGFSAGSTFLEAQAGQLMATVPLVVSSAPLSTLEVSPALPDPLGIGGAAAFTAWGTFADEGVLELTGQVAWSSSNPAVLSLPPTSGTVTALDAGSAVVQAAFGGQPAASFQSVVAAAPVGLHIWPPLPHLLVGLPGALAAEEVFSDGTVEDASQLVGWTSSCPPEVEVSTGARGGALAARTAASCTAKADLGGLYGSVSVAATTPVLSQLDVSPVQAVLGAGGRLALTATATFGDGSVVDVTSLAAWTSSAAGVVVAGNGPEAGQGLAADAGVSQLTASFNGASATSAITVVSETPQVEVWPPMVLLHAGTQASLRVTAVWASGDAVDVTPWTVFASSNASVAAAANAAGQRGAVTGHAGGAATVTALWASVAAHAAVAVDTATPTAVAVLGPSAIPAAEVGAFRASAHYSDGSEVDATAQALFLSSAPGVLRLRGTGPSRGAAVALAPGSATAQALVAGIKGSTPVAATPGGLLALSLPPVGPLPAGIQVQLAVSASYPGGHSLDVTGQASWTSSSPEVASVSSGPEAGLLRAKQPGTSLLSATYEGMQAAVSVTVNAVSLTGITILPSAPTGALGVAVPLQAIGNFADGTQYDVTAQARWSSASPSFTAVSNGRNTQGMAVALLAGTTSLSASVARPDTTVATGSVSFVGSPSVTVGIEVVPASVTLSLSGDASVALRADAHLSDGTVRDVSSSVSWSVEGSSVAAVTAAGVLSAVKTGTATVLATLGGLSGTAPVQVSP